MAFFTSAIGTLKVLVIALGAGLGVWGVINLLEGYGNDNPGAKSQGIAATRTISSTSQWETCRSENIRYMTGAMTVRTF